MLEKFCFTVWPTCINNVRRNHSKRFVCSTEQVDTHHFPFEVIRPDRCKIYCTMTSQSKTGEKPQDLKCTLEV